MSRDVHKQENRTVSCFIKDINGSVRVSRVFYLGIMEDEDPAARARCSRQFRNWAGFGLLGLCNNFAYVVMLSAAHDILKKQESNNSSASALVSPAVDVGGGNSSNSSTYDCNPVSTGAVLLADILPTLAIKLCAPFVIHYLPYGVRVLFCVVMAASSFLLVSFSSAVWMSILGVVFASLGAGLGELSFLSLTVFFNRNVLEGWGSGTGAAGVAGAVLYSGLIQEGLSPRVTLLIMLVVPLLMIVSYFGLLVPVSSFPQWRRREMEAAAENSEDRRQLLDGSEEDEEDENVTEVRTSGPLSFTEKLQIIRGLLKFIFPLGLVYFAEYFINQGLMELLFFPNIFLSHAEQYRWYQVLYQIGVFLSRSSLRCVKIRKIWILSLLQVVNAVFLWVAVRYQFLPSVWFVFAVVLYEGLLGGAAYVNTFYFISTETEGRHREFAMAASSVGDSVGIAMAALAAFPVHSYFCSL
ncbi:battenin [Melanotaenia boesemani]|uniref:battenin n=1 Tax=Melanotaenia boesemani TaxID=1250792 RepID=UPI001C04377E|nr:battenin [Melanotaenia boesemani]